MLMFDIKQMESRFKDFLGFMRKPREACNDFTVLRNACEKLEGEEALFLAFLDTHFHSLQTAEDFRRELSWKKLLQFNKADMHSGCKRFFKTKRKIGDHRRYFRCLSLVRKIEYTVKTLQSYRETMRDSGSQKAFFEFGERPKFDCVYQKMSRIFSFSRRLPRFDHLERLVQAFKWSATPERFYAEEASGPLSGLTYLVIGRRYGKDKRVIRQYLKTNFPDEWKAQVGSQFAIQSNASFSEVIQILEQWFIQRVKQELPYRAKHDAFVFDLETCLCNWQKRKQ